MLGWGGFNVHPSDIATDSEDGLMFVDSVVLAGVVTVGLMVVFLGGVAYFIWRDSKKKRS